MAYSSFRKRRSERKKEGWGAVTDVTFTVNLDEGKNEIPGYYTLGVMVDEVRAESFTYYSTATFF